jgi:hypothetical protein
MHRYRITCLAASSGTKVTVDGMINGTLLNAGESRDVAGKRIVLQITSSQGEASGTYDNLD